MNNYSAILVEPVANLLTRGNLPNLGLAAIDAYLNHKGYKCKVIDSPDIDKYIDKSNVFGVSVLDDRYAAAQELTRSIKDKTVVWGGWAVMTRPDFILRENPEVDYVILQDGEKRMLKLLESMKKPEIFDTIDGIAYRDKNSEIIVRSPKEFFNMDEIPVPDNNTMEMPRRVNVAGIVHIELARGCYAHCAYCQHIRKMRFRSAKKVAGEIQYWYERGYKHFYIGNDNSMAKTELLREFVEELEERELRVKIKLTGRPNDVLKSLHIIEKIFKSDIVKSSAIEMGIESNSQRMLDLLSRGLTPEINRKAMDAISDLKEKYSPETIIYADIILFSHWDMTIDDFVENVRFIGHYRCSRDTLSLRVYGSMGTPLWEDMRSNGFNTKRGLGQRIVEYPFNDDKVESLYDKLVRIPLIEETKNKNFHAPDFHINFQHKVHDTILEFYHSNNIKQAVINFINKERL